MKKLITIFVLFAAMVGFCELQCVQLSVSNTLPATAAQAGVYGFKQFVAKGENMQVYCALKDVALCTPTSITNAAQTAVTNANGYVFSQYGKFATTTPQNYLGAFKKGDVVTLWAKTRDAYTLTTGTNILQSVYIYIW